MMETWILNNVKFHFNQIIKQFIQKVKMKFVLIKIDILNNRIAFNSLVLLFIISASLLHVTQKKSKFYFKTVEENLKMSSRVRGNSETKFSEH